MNVEELKEIIKNLPDEMDVFISERVTEFGFGLVNSTYVKEIFFTEDEVATEEEIEQSPREKVLIIDEQKNYRK